MDNFIINDWTVNISEKVIALRGENKVALFDERKNLILFLTCTENGNLEVERCNTMLEFKVDNKKKDITILL